MALSPISGGLSPAQIAAIQALRAQTAVAKPAPAAVAPAVAPAAAPAQAPAEIPLNPRGGRGQIINITV
jgi:hypothetical protein